MIAITAATGQLGRLVLERLATLSVSEPIVAIVRNPSKASDLAAKGVTVRRGDYTDPASLDQAFAGVDKLLLISSSEVGQRAVQHRNAVEAAKRQKVKFLAYTSILHADTTPIGLAEEHRATEAMIKSSGLTHALLRNGWYTENYTVSIPAALQHGAWYGSAGTGRVSSATRLDYAEAAAKVLTGNISANKTYELAGDSAFSLPELAAELSRQTGKSIPYVDLPEADVRAALLKAGLPEWLAHGLAHWDACVAKGALLDDSHQLSGLIGRPTTPLADAVRAALKK